MKSLWVIGIVALLAGSGLLYGWNSARQRAELAALEQGDRPIEARGADWVARESTPVGADVRAEVESLEQLVIALQARIEALESEVGDLRSSADREPRIATARPSIDAATAGLSDAERDAVLEVIAEQQRREQEQRDLQRAERDKARIDRRAERVAQELNLAAGDQERLVAVMTAESAKWRELFGQFQDGSVDRETMRDSMEQMRTWRTTEYNAAFGPALGEQILAQDRSGFGGFGGFGADGGRARRGGGEGFGGRFNEGGGDGGQ